jgi:phospholipid transport system transporter-binding protein
VTDAILEAAGEGRWRLSGILNFASVPGVWRDLERLLEDQDSMAISLADVQQANSAGLVMLLEAIEVARRNGCDLMLRDLPSEFLDLAKMSSCGDLISAAR